MRSDLQSITSSGEELKPITAAGQHVQDRSVVVISMVAISVVVISVVVILVVVILVVVISVVVIYGQW